MTDLLAAVEGQGLRQVPIRLKTIPHKITLPPKHWAGVGVSPKIRYAAKMAAIGLKAPANEASDTLDFFKPASHND